MNLNLPTTIKTLEAQVSKPFDSKIPTNVAVNFVSNPNISNGNGDNSDLAQHRIRLSGIAYLAGSNKNINRLTNGIVYCHDLNSYSNNCSDNSTNNPYFTDENGQRNNMKGYAAVYSDGNRLGEIGRAHV